ncbi:hypothetical protein [Microvirga arabica]|uniref:hypothetical protein n=1 Tax=Microvirga arabica TaxID=1128671 RepID=UPI00193951B6|nr:hypothetical protein [Microvirga arabica]MBM1172847.1 hypothetical protein [Microvirga arabica]
MKKIIPALILALAGTPALAVGPVTLERSLLACSYAHDWQDLRKMSLQDKVAAERFFYEKGCVILEKGTKVYAQRTFETTSDQCLRPEGETECYWTYRMDWSN